MRIAYLEDDPDQAVLVARWLQAAGHECAHFSTGASLLEALADPLPDLLLLDWQLPDTSGEAVLGAVRERFGARPPIVFLSAHDDAEDLLRVLQAGATDHIRKPVERAELLARVEAVAAAAGGTGGEERSEFPPYVFDRGARTVTAGKRPAKLDDAEFDVALLLFENAGQIVTLPVLAAQVASSTGEKAGARAAQACVARVRAKLRLTPASGWQLRTVAGVGFRLELIG